MMWLRFAILILLVMPAANAAPDANGKVGSVNKRLSFIQLTDAHIFDDGWKEKGSEPYWKAVDDRTALHWAVESINTLAEINSVHFIVYTGDFGLQNVFFSDSTCSLVPFKSEPGIPPFSSEMAANELALELNRLKVRTIYVVPGNNDIINEKVTDGRRFECFIEVLQAKLGLLATLEKLTPVHLQLLQADAVVQEGGLRLAGMNTASFKKENENYKTECSSVTSMSTVLRNHGCPMPQMESLGKLIDQEDSPLLLFTHIPDLIDPYEKEKNPGRTQSSWDIERQVRVEWGKLATRSRLAGIFAGHFHSAKLSVYANTVGTQYLSVDPIVTGKTWVAPPLAGKNQRNGGPQARGFMLVNIDQSPGALKIDASPVWYPMPVSTSATPFTTTTSNSADNGGPMTDLGFFGLSIVVILFTGFFGGVLNYLLNKKDDPEDPGLWRNLVLGIGAALLVPLFLHVIGSNLVSQMHNGAGGHPDYSQVLVFGGFCLVAAMSAKTFIQSISDRVLKRAERAEKLADEAEQKASRAQIVAERFIEPPEGKSSELSAFSADITPSDDECGILKALANTKYVLRTSSGLAVETKISKSYTDDILKRLKELKLAETTEFTASDRQTRQYWYITAEGRSVLLKCQEQK